MIKIKAVSTIDKYIKHTVKTEQNGKQGNNQLLTEHVTLLYTGCMKC